MGVVNMLVLVMMLKLTAESAQENAKFIWNHFRTIAWTNQAIASMLGNIEAESGILCNRKEEYYGLKQLGCTNSKGEKTCCNTTGHPIWCCRKQEYDNNECGYGLTQWTPASKLINWCSGRNLDPKKVESQCKRIEYESTTETQWNRNLPMTFAAFTRCIDVDNCTKVFLRNYEVPQDWASKLPGRVTNARNWYNRFLSWEQDEEDTNVGYHDPPLIQALQPSSGKYEIGNPLEFTWDAVDGATQYVVKVKRLSASVTRPDVLSDNEDGDIIFPLNGGTAYAHQTITLNGYTIGTSESFIGRFLKVYIEAQNAKGNFLSRDIAYFKIYPKKPTVTCTGSLRVGETIHFSWVGTSGFTDADYVVKAKILSEGLPTASTDTSDEPGEFIPPANMWGTGTSRTILIPGQINCMNVADKYIKIWISALGASDSAISETFYSPFTIDGVTTTYDRPSVRVSKPNTGVYEIGDPLEFTWDAVDGSTEYDVKVKRLHGSITQPDELTDNEDGDLVFPAEVGMGYARQTISLAPSAVGTSKSHIGRYVKIYVAAKDICGAILSHDIQYLQIHPRRPNITVTGAFTVGETITVSWIGTLGLIDSEYEFKAKVLGDGLPAADTDLSDEPGEWIPSGSITGSGTSRIVVIPDKIRDMNTNGKYIKIWVNAFGVSDSQLSDTFYSPGTIQGGTLATTYTVHFNAGGGSTPISSRTVNAGTTIKLPTAVRGDYTLSGWYTAASSGTKVGDAQADYTVYSPIQLFAQWEMPCVEGEGAEGSECAASFVSIPLLLIALVLVFLL